jgi:hypothetical protein
MRRTFLAPCLLLCLLLGPVPARAAVGERVMDRAGGFALCAPQGWTFRPFPGLKYKVALAPAVDGFSSNLNLVDEAFGGDLEHYVAANLASMKPVFPGFQILGQGAFTTAHQLEGYRVVTTSLQQNRRLRQVFYFMPGGRDHYFVITCSTLAANQGALDAGFDESVRTFECMR